MQKLSTVGKFHFKPPCPFTSLDHLVGQLLDVQRDVEAERPGRLQVDDELEFRRLQHRQIGWLGALEDLTGVGADLTIHARTIGVVAHQPAGFDSLATGIARGNPVVRRKRNKLDASTGEEHVASDVQGIGAVVHESSEGSLDLAPGAGVEDLNLQCHCTGGFRYLSYALGTSDIGRIDQHGNPNGLRHQLVQKCQPLRTQLSCEKIDAGQVSARPGEAGDETELDGVFADAEDDRDRRGRSFGGKRSSVAGWRGDNGDTTTHEVSHERRKAIELALKPVVLHRYVLALDIAGFVKALSESGGKGCIA